MGNTFLPLPLLCSRLCPRVCACACCCVGLCVRAGARVCVLACVRAGAREVRACVRAGARGVRGGGCLRSVHVRVVARAACEWGLPSRWELTFSLLTFTPFIKHVCVRACVARGPEPGHSGLCGGHGCSAFLHSQYISRISKAAGTPRSDAAASVEQGFPQQGASPPPSGEKPHPGRESSSVGHWLCSWEICYPERTGLFGPSGRPRVKQGSFNPFWSPGS